MALADAPKVSARFELAEELEHLGFTWEAATDAADEILALCGWPKARSITRILRRHKQC